MSYDFRFVRNKTGELSGQSMVVQSEIALSEIGTTAETAQETAESAASTASTALSTAESAESSAGTAQTTADKAVALANMAQEAADTAQATAEAAQATADEAVELANTAQATAETAQETADSKAPIYHASEEETYGVGNEDLYGHLKLLDEANEDYTISSGVAATPYALSLVQDEAETAQATADTAVSLANTSQTAADSAMSYAETVNTTVTSLSTTVNETITDLAAHIADTDNPHNVTASQLGLATAYKYCGTVSTYDDLPTDAEQGDVYNVDDTGANYAWTGEEWDKLSETVDLSSYVTTATLTSTLADYATINYVDTAIAGIDLSDYATSEDLANVTVEAISDDDITALFA